MIRLFRGGLIMGNNKHVKRVWWALTVVWCVFIFVQSQQNAAESSSKSAFIMKIINSLISRITNNDEFALSEYFIRKTAHFTEYFILGFLLYGSLKKEGFKLLYPALSILISAAYAISDEIHQYFIPGRVMSLFDVFIDTCGAAVGVFLFCIILALRNKISFKSKQ